MKGAAKLFQFLLDCARRGERTALATITDVIGSSSRSTGTHIAVSETGAFRGSFSGGCVEAAVVGEALRVIRTGRAEIMRFGAGSRFIDVRLPCGGAIDFLVTPEPDEEIVAQALRRLAEREPILLRLGRDGVIELASCAEGDTTGWNGDMFQVRHLPDLRLLIAGHGMETLALASQAQAYGAEVVVLSPDAELVGQTSALGARSWLLASAGRSPHLACDRFTAVAMLFHDHDWEIKLLEQALEQDAFFIGAMGSRRTHRQRLEALEAQGVPPQALARLEGPIGLIPASRDPETLALSALSQIVARYQAIVAEAPARAAPSAADDRPHALQAEGR